MSSDHGGCSLKRHQSTDPVLDELNAKKRRVSKDPLHWVPSSRFWDSLPKIHLTRRALNELNRRKITEKQREKNSHPPKTINRNARYSIGQRRSARLQQSGRPALLPSVENRPSDLDLRRFSRFGGPDLTALRGFPEPAMSDDSIDPSKQTTTSGKSARPRRSSAYDANYQTKLAQAGVFLTRQTDENGDYVLPANYDAITARLNQRRRSLSPSRFNEKCFRDFEKTAELATNESTTMQRVISIIEGQRGQFHSLSGSHFNNIKPFDPELAITVPDQYDGTLPKAIDHRVLKDLDKHIIPSTDPSRPAVPNFFLEGKGAKGRADVAQRQAAHNGAVGARAMMSLQSYPARTPQYDNKAYSFTNTYYDGTMKIYATHATPPESNDDLNRPQYHMTQLKAFAMTGDSDTFRRGATHYRNARDLAKEMRDSFIQRANQAARQMPTTKHNHPSTATTDTISTVRNSEHSAEYESSSDTDTSTDELAFEKSFK